MREMLDRIRAAEEAAQEQIEAAIKHGENALALAKKNADEEKARANHQADLIIREKHLEAEKKAEEDTRQIFLKGQSERKQLQAMAVRRQQEAIRQIFIFLLGSDLENLKG